MADAPPLGWGLVGPGEIAGVFAESLAETGAGRVVRVVGRSPERTAAFCARSGGAPADDLAALLDDSDVQAVYVATPHACHPEAVRAALDAGRAVLCEKPLAVDPATVAALHAHARDREVPLVEGWMYRAHPQLERALALVRGGAIGELERLESGFCFAADVPDTHRLRDPGLGGGAILDVGGYPVSLAMRVAAAVAPDDDGRAWREPDSLAARVRATSTGVDAHAEAVLVFAGGLHAEVSCSIEEELGCSAVLHGSAGRLEIEEPFLPEGRRRGLVGRLLLTRWDDDAPTNGAGARVVDATVEEVVAAEDCFAAEARVVAGMVARGDADPPAPMIGAEESVALSRVLAAWRTTMHAED